MPKNGTLRKKKRMKARRGMDRATGVADEGGNGTRPPRTALARGPTFADAPIPRGAAGTKRPADDDDARERLREERRQRCLLYTSPSPRDGLLSRMPSSA